jgi:hypothetical protein
MSTQNNVNNLKDYQEITGSVIVMYQYNGIPSKYWVECGWISVFVWKTKEDVYYDLICVIFSSICVLTI